MKHEILARPSYSALRCVLEKGEELHAESGAMLAMDATALIGGSMKGGLLGGIKRALLTSESFFVTTIRAEDNETEVYLAPRAPGDIQGITLQNNAYIVQGGSFLASTPGIRTDAKFSGWKGFLSGEGIFMIRAEGAGDIFVSSFGGIIGRELKAGERFVVDNGHIVAFDATMPYEIQAVGGGMVGAVKTGEGLACVFTGPGMLYLQTRNLATFAETLNPFLPNRSKAQGGMNLLGQVFGN